jgi:hypothetical protein
MYQVEQPPGRLPDISALVHCFPDRWKHLSRIYPAAAPREGFVQKNSAHKGLAQKRTLCWSYFLITPSAHTLKKI